MPRDARAARPARSGGGARVRLLDGFDVYQDGNSLDLPPGTQRLVALVALHRRQAQRSLLAGQLWPEAGEDEALARLRSALWRLRRRCCHVVETGSGEVRLAPGTAVDVDELEARTRRLIDPGARLQPADEDPAGLCGELLPDWWEDWVLTERERLRQLRLHALEHLAERMASSDRYARALDVALAAVALEPLRESPHRLVMSIHLAEGNRSEALRAYESYRELLRTELGVTPSPRMEAVVASLHGRSDRSGTRVT